MGKRKKLNKKYKLNKVREWQLNVHLPISTGLTKKNYDYKEESIEKNAIGISKVPVWKNEKNQKNICENTLKNTLK